ncbi:ToMV resistance protein Tm-2(2) [Sesamum alatum]|uniref:ToMV resistance protein Tm-2(2) n=1 Tax=Sesamum alatum TaxID=300844 RepID=A0AAE1YBL4_9LAMI|nr:ToMV resistance protein Tm-2(2) [Sesamum alatum]
MAYAALVSLKLIIERLLKSCPGIIDLAYENVKSLQELFTLEDGSNNARVKAVEREIREAAYRLEDVLESHVSTHFLSQSQTLDGDLALEVKEEISFFTETVKKIKEQLSSLLQQPEEDDAVGSCRRYHFEGNKSKIFGLDHDLVEIKDLLLNNTTKHLVVPIVGMAGIGKTTLAKAVYGDPDIVSHYECRAFVLVGPEYVWRDIVLGILAQMDLEINEMHAQGEGRLGLELRIRLFHRRYPIVLDDIWDEKTRDILCNYLPETKNGSRIILTTRIEKVAQPHRTTADGHGHKVHQMRFLNDKESWHLLCYKVFGEEKLYPPHLETAGKKIAKKCKGLPLTIISVAKHLFEAKKTPEYWEMVANKVHSIIGADKETSKVLFLSYKYLAPHLKACFVYMGVFPHDHDVPASDIVKLWCTEGFLESSQTKNLEDVAMKCLEDLVSRNVVEIRKRSSSGGIKTCNIYSVFWHICIAEAQKDKFFHIIEKDDNHGIESQRRLCIHNNVLYGIKDVRNLMTSISSVRSILCTGPNHQYPTPICLGFSLLRVLDALTIRFYRFPSEVVKLVQLKYLAFTYNGKLQHTISNLCNLQYLIVRQYLSILTSKAGRPDLPKEIWNMRELKHLEVMGSDIPHPSYDDALLPNLCTLLGISARNCTKEILGRIPNLKKLGIQIELAPDVAETLCWFDYLASLLQLESLKCSIVNPNFQVVLPTSRAQIFPPGLKKLTLSGLGFPWEYMKTIAQLPNLKVLKLQCYAFRGPVWEIDYVFLKLRFLLIEDTDLEIWDASDFNFRSLECLIFRHCYKLQEVPEDIGDSGFLEMIELVDCSPSLVASAEQLAKDRPKSRKLEVVVKSSDGKLKS